MIHDFIQSWALFGNVYLVGWLVALMLGLIGVVVVARNQVFVGAALAQGSTLGIALTMWATAALGAGPWAESDLFLTAVATAISVAGALATTRATGPGRESPEGITGWLFLLGAAGSIVVVSHSPHGLEEIQRLTSSTIIGATRAHVALFATAAAITALAIGLRWRAILLWIMDPTTAQAAGIPIGRLETLAAAWLGLAVGLSIRVSGTLYTFGCLVLPALIAKSLCREVRSMFLVAPCAAVLLAGAAFIAANHFDFPPAQLAIAFMAAGLPVGWVFKRLRRAA